MAVTRKEVYNWAESQTELGLTPNLSLCSFCSL
jgi:hypothetical protein